LKSKALPVCLSVWQASVLGGCHEQSAPATCCHDSE
jgi:hypothetical protein